MCCVYVCACVGCGIYYECVCMNGVCDMWVGVVYEGLSVFEVCLWYVELCVHGVYV